MVVVREVGGKDAGIYSSVEITIVGAHPGTHVAHLCNIVVRKIGRRFFTPNVRDEEQQ